MEQLLNSGSQIHAAVAGVQAGVDHILPFCEPYRDVSGDPTALVRDLRDIFADWAQRPYITAALVRFNETAEAALRDGAGRLEGVPYSRH